MRYHYQLVAECIKAERDSWPHHAAGERGANRALNGVVLRLALEFELNNTRFDRVQFADAAGFTGTLPPTDRSVGARGA